MSCKAYATDWRLFVTWCEVGSEDETKPVTGWMPRRALPASPETLCQYTRHIVEADGRKVSTVTRRLASISVAHQGGRRLGRSADQDARGARDRSKH